MLATATRYSHYCTCLGHLGQWDTDKIISSLQLCVAVADSFANNLRQCKRSIKCHHLTFFVALDLVLKWGIVDYVGKDFWPSVSFIIFFFFVTDVAAKIS